MVLAKKHNIAKKKRTRNNFQRKYCFIQTLSMFFSYTDPENLNTLSVSIDAFLYLETFNGYKRLFPS